MEDHRGICLGRGPFFFFSQWGLEILCVDDWLSSTRTDTQAGVYLSLRFNKTHHIVPH